MPFWFEVQIESPFQQSRRRCLMEARHIDETKPTTVFMEKIERNFL